MSRDDSGATVPRRPTVGYYLTLAAAMVGLVCLAVAIQGVRRTLRGGDGLGAFNEAGVPALIVAWALAFYARLAFAPKLAPTTRAAVRNSLRVVFGVEIVVAVLGSGYVLTHAASDDLRGVLVLGDVMQAGTLAWLLRYSAE